MSVSNIENILHIRKIAPTAMRLLVLEFLYSKTHAVSLQEIEDSFYKADKVTLYRTLKTFEKKGIVHAIQDKNTTRYALCDIHCDEHAHADSHIHFHCTQCKQIFCMHKIEIPQFSLPKNYSIEEMNLTISGVCPDCAS